MNIKKPSVAGQFYTSDSEQLSANIESYLINKRPDCNYKTRAIIVPHAGHEYSGELAAKGYQYLKKDLEVLFIFAPAHRYFVETLAISDYDAFETPLGEIYTHKEYTNELNEAGAEYNNNAFINEHSIEVQLPFIKELMPEANIVPILVGGADFKTISSIIKKYWDKEKTGFIISSDLSHFHNQQEAQKIDVITADMIENLTADNFLPEQACGYKGVCGLIDFAKEKGFSLMRVGLTDSSEKTGNTSSVVGYGSWYLAEKEKTEFFKEYFSDVIKNLCAVSIKSQIDRVNLKIENFPRALETRGAAFVTLDIAGNLRGCIGSIIAHEPLIVDLCKNARNAAFNDPRFTPVEAKELEKINLTVSILSAPERINFKDENDLLEKIKAGEGLIIKDIGRQAVYLPEVWEQLPEKTVFLKSLKQKAGLQPEWFSDTFEAYRFTTVLIR